MFIFKSKKKIILFSLSLIIILISCLSLYTFENKKKLHNEEIKVLNYWVSLYKLDQVKEVRKSFNGILNKTRRKFIHSDQYLDYFSSPFKVTQVRNAPMGGEFVRLFFVDKFDAFFDVWVYEISENEYQVRSISKVNTPLEKFQKVKNNLAFYCKHTELQM